ncbi:MAG TPA: hypothetical protein VFG63_00020 [Nocardioidaceae bacterium]|nr:hypothetical protein [Nocardioidaceae bacterium]
MSRLSAARSFLDGLTGLTGQQALLRVLVAALPGLAFGVEVQAGAPVQTVPVALVLVLTVISALVPDSHGPLAVVLVLGGYWVISVEESLSWQLLVLTGLLLAFHVVCLLACYGPASVVLDRVLIGLWLRRTALLGAVAVLVWLAARLAGGLDLPASPWLFAAGLLVVVGATGTLSRRLAVGAG